MPVISPLSIYLIMSISNVALAIGVLSMCFFVVALIIALHTADQLSLKDDQKTVRYKKALKNAYAGVVFFILALLVPSKETIIMMTATKYITIENVQIGKEVVEKVYNDILTIVKGEDENANN